MSNLHRLAKPSSISVTSKLISTPLRDNTRAPRNGSAYDSGDQPELGHYLQRSGESSNSIIVARFVGWLHEAAQTRAHEHGCDRRQPQKLHPRRPGTSIQSVQRQNQRALSTKSSRRAAADASAVAHKHPLHYDDQHASQPMPDNKARTKPFSPSLRLGEGRSSKISDARSMQVRERDGSGMDSDPKTGCRGMQEAVTWSFVGEELEGSHSFSDGSLAKDPMGPQCKEISSLNKSLAHFETLDVQQTMARTAHTMGGNSATSRHKPAYGLDRPQAVIGMSDRHEAHVIARIPASDTSIAVPPEEYIALVQPPDSTTVTSGDRGTDSARPRTGIEALETLFAAQEARKEQMDETERKRQEAHAERIRLFPLASRLAPLHEKVSTATLMKRNIQTPLDQHTAGNLHQLKAMLKQPPGLVMVRDLWACYDQIDGPQVKYLKDIFVQRMFAHLSTVEYFNAPGARARVLEFYRQCIDQKVWLHRRSWTTAMVYAGRGERVPTLHHVRSAVEIWMEIEDRGGKADNVVFNVLYHIAAKARRFALAQTFLDEIKMRELPINRYLRCSMIYCAGLRGDANAVRSEFADFVNAGEVVDTAVMNCIIRAMIWAKDGEGAESTFENMKALQLEKFFTVPVSAWQDRRQLARRADYVRKTIRQQQERHKKSFFGGSYTDKDRLHELQLLSPVAPDDTTYRMMVGYHALITGNIHRVRELMSEMTARGFYQHGSMYQKIFHAFHLHGAPSGSPWSAARLEKTWQDFVALLPYSHQVSDQRISYINSRERAPQFFKATATEVASKQERRKSRLAPDQQEHDPDKDDVTFDKQGRDINEGYAFDSDINLPAGDELGRAPYFSIAMAKSILRAFWICCGEHRLMRAYLEICARWKTMNEEERAVLLEFVHALRGPYGARLVRRSKNSTNIALDRSVG